MRKDIFIGAIWSDLEPSERICKALEGDGNSCWLSWRDIGPGAHNENAAAEEIAGSRLLLLVLSANASVQFDFERYIALAEAAGLPIYAVRIEPIGAGDALPGLAEALERATPFDGSAGQLRRIVYDVAGLLDKTRPLIFSLSASEERTGAGPIADGGAFVTPLTAPLSDQQLGALSLRRAAAPAASPYQRLLDQLPAREAERPQGIGSSEGNSVYARLAMRRQAGSGDFGAISPPMAAPAPAPPNASAPAPMPASRPSRRRSSSAGLWALIAAGGIAAVVIGDRVFGGQIAALLAGAAKLLHLSTMPSPSGAEAAADTVDVSVFAPPSAGPGDSLLVQVFLHPFDYEPQKIEASATAADPTAARRGEATLDVGLERGERLDICIDAPGLDIPEPVQPFVWRGRARSVQFLAAVPADQPLGLVQFRIRVLRASIPIGQVRFALRIEAHSAFNGLGKVGDSAARFSRAFLSYAHEDRAEVLKRAQALRAARIEVFQDLLSLEPGEKWNERLWTEIDQCDLFLLFWSKAARQSEWVGKEVDRALENQARSGKSVPEIMPVILEGPPPPEPPDRFRHLHFDDRICYLIAAHQH